MTKTPESGRMLQPNQASGEQQQNFDLLTSSPVFRKTRSNGARFGPHCFRGSGWALNDSCLAVLILGYFKCSYSLNGCSAGGVIAQRHRDCRSLLLPCLTVCQLPQQSSIVLRLDYTNLSTSSFPAWYDSSVRS